MAQVASNIIPFAFEDRLVRAVQKNGDPWFVGKDVCEVLGLTNHNKTLERLDTDERMLFAIPTPSAKGVTNSDPLCASGNEQTVIIVSEAGVYRLVFTSRKPEAERFKRWLAHDVLPQIRKTGEYRRPHDDDEQMLINAETAREIEIKLAMVNTAARVFGAERARAVWSQVGLAMPAEPRPGGVFEARECLDHLLVNQIDGAFVHRLLSRAMNDDAEAADILKRNGIWAEPQNDGFVVANRHAELLTAYKGTVWEDYQWCYKLRRLAGAQPVKPRKFEKDRAVRGVFVPASWLDAKMPLD